MGQKTNPIGLRLAVNRDWRSKWYAGKKEFGKLLTEDRQIRELLKKKLETASVPKILIERAANRCRITTRTGRQDGDAAAVGGALNHNLRHRSRLHLLLQQLANLAVFRKQFAEFFFAGIPLRAPVTIDGQAKTNWISFLTHTITYSSVRTIFTWQFRFKIGPAEPRAFGVNRFSVVAVCATASLMRNDSILALLLFSAFAMADFNVLA